MSHRPLRSRLPSLLALGVWALVLVRVIVVFAPGSVHHAIPYNSDAAIPVLMANDDRPLSPLSLYYWGADRFGGWPYAVLAVLHRWAGIWWTPEAVFALQATWVLLGAWIAGSLAPRDRWAAGLAVVLTLCLQHDTRHLPFHLGQVHGWIATALLLAWWAMRRLFDLDPGTVRSTDARSFVATAGLAAALLLALLTSFTTLPFLLVLLALETARAAARSRGAGGRRRWRRRLAGAGAALAAALAVERLLHRLHVHDAVREGQAGMLFRPSLDVDHLAANLARHLAGLARADWASLYLIAALAPLGIALGCALRDAPRSARTPATEPRRLLRFGARAGRHDTVVFVLGAVLIAALQLALVIATDWVRLHLYDPRFLTLTHLFAPVAALTAIHLAARRALGRRWPRARPALLAAGMLWLVSAFPDPRTSPRYLRLQRIADTLAERAPGGVLAGGYWETYVFASLQPTATMTPVQQTYDRTPWNAAALDGASEIVFEVGHLGRYRPVEGDPAAPDRIRLYDRVFRLAEPDWLVDGAHRFALYRPAGSALLREDFETGTSGTSSDGRWSRVRDRRGDR